MCVYICVFLYVCVSILLHRKLHQVCVHEEAQQEVVNILQFLRSSHVQHQDPSFRFPVENKTHQTSKKTINKTKTQQVCVHLCSCVSGAALGARAAAVERLLTH